MKRLITVGVLLACIVAVCITSQAVLTDCAEAVGTPLSEGIDAAQSDDIETARQKAVEAEMAFMDREKWLNLFVHRDLVENLGAQIARLTDLAEEETLSEYRADAKSTLVMLTHVVEDERSIL